MSVNIIFSKRLFNHHRANDHGIGRVWNTFGDGKVWAINCKLFDS